VSRRTRDPQAEQIAATVASESRPYTDPRAGYDRARDAQQARTEGAFRRGRR
jgi:hypothetical protein